MENIKMAKALMNSKQRLCRTLQRTCLIIGMMWIGSAIYGQVVFQNSAFFTIPNGTTATSISMSYDPGTANNRIMIVAVTTSRRDVFSATFAGEPLELLGNVQNGNSRVVFFTLLDPPSGSAILQASLESDDRGFAMGVATFSNVNQVTPLNTFTPVTGSSATPTISNVPTSAGSIVFSAISYRNGSRTYNGVGADQTQLWQFQSAISNDRHWSIGSRKSIVSGTNTNVSYAFSNAEDFSAGAVSINPIPTSDLSITKTVNNSTPFIGQTISFTLTASNLTAGSTASLVNVNDLLPDGYTFVSATPSAGTYNAGNGVWTIGNLANGTPRTLTITAVVRSVNAYLNIATISSENNLDPVAGNNTAQVTIVPCLAGGTAPLFGNQP